MAESTPSTFPPAPTPTRAGGNETALAPRKSSRVVPALVLAVSLTVAGVAGVVLIQSRSTPPATPVAAAATEATQETPALPPPPPLPPDVPVPSLVYIPTLGVKAEVDAVGVRESGDVDVPESGQRVGWYRFGSTPTDGQGSTVLVGHRDTQAEGRGVLYGLRDAQPGDVISVVLSDWTTMEYQVTETQSIDKATLPVDDLFREDGPSVLRVITCGGAYIPGQGYEENVVVTAVPMTPAGASGESQGDRSSAATAESTQRPEGQDVAT